jgi:hypothetical protein
MMQQQPGIADETLRRGVISQITKLQNEILIYKQSKDTYKKWHEAMISIYNLVMKDLEVVLINGMPQVDPNSAYYKDYLIFLNFCNQHRKVDLTLQELETFRIKNKINYKTSKGWIDFDKKTSDANRTKRDICRLENTWIYNLLERKNYNAKLKIGQMSAGDGG